MRRAVWSKRRLTQLCGRISISILRKKVPDPALFLPDLALFLPAKKRVRNFPSLPFCTALSLCDTVSGRIGLFSLHLLFWCPRLYQKVAVFRIELEEPCDNRRRCCPLPNLSPFAKKRSNWSFLRSNTVQAPRFGLTGQAKLSTQGHPSLLSFPRHPIRYEDKI